VASSLQSVAIALGWVLLGLASLASTVVALWVCSSMAKAASVGRDGFFASGAWTILIAIVATLGVPFAIAAWKGQRDARRISLTMAWLPMLWNAGGLALATQLVPDLMSAALHTQGAWIAADRLGDTHSATRVMSALGHHTADVLSPPERPAGLEFEDDLVSDSSSEVDRSKAVSVPMADEGTAIYVDTVLEGRDGRHVKLPYLFDTGASFTTISSETAAKLGIEIPDDAPILTFNTASGPRESRMVYLPAVRVGQVRVEGLLVSVCDGCVNKRHLGLLGQNVMRRFFVQMDFKTGRTLLIPRMLDERPNRAYDIEPVVEMEVDGAPEIFLGRLRWVVTVKNNSTVPLRDVTPVVKFTDGPTLPGETISVIGPGEVGRSLVEGKASDGRGKSKGHYQLSLAEAYW
jgi:hypothetical protein